MKKIVVLLVLVLSCEMMFGQKYTKKKDYSEGLAAVYFQERWGFVDKNDKLVINYAFEDVKPFKNGVAQVKYQGKWIYIDKKGKVTSAPQIAQNRGSSSSSSSSSSSKSGSTNSISSNNKGSSSTATSPISSSHSNSNIKSSSSTSSKTNSNNSSSSYTSSKQNNKYLVFDDELKVEEDGFSWIETSAKDLEAWNKGKLRYVSGAKDRYGNVLIPLSRDYEYVFYSNDWNEGIPSYFEVRRGDYMGVCTIDGTEIIAPKFYGYVFYDTDSDVFVCTKEPAKQSDLWIQHQYYSLGISINKKGEAYRSNKAISPISEYYPYTIQGFATLSGKVTCKGQGVPHAKVLCNDVHWDKSYAVEADSYGNYSICIPRSPRDTRCVIYAQGNGYYDSYAQYWQGWDENHYMNFELEPIVNQSSYANVNSNNYGSSISDASKAFIFGAILLGGAVAIIDALSNSSSTSSSNSSLDPCWSNDIPGSDKVWLSEANFEQSSDYIDGKSRTAVTLKFHNDNNWPMKVTYQVVYKNEKSSDKPDLRWIGLEKDDKSTTETIVGQPGKVIECIKLRKIEPARY